MKTVNVHEAKTQLSRLIDRAHQGEEIVIAKAGKPYARLVPLQKATGKRRPGLLEHLGPVPESFFEPMGDDELEAWGT